MEQGKLSKKSKPETPGETATEVKRQPRKPGKQRRKPNTPQDVRKPSHLAQDTPDTTVAKRKKKMTKGAEEPPGKDPSVKKDSEGEGSRIQQEHESTDPPKGMGQKQTNVESTRQKSKRLKAATGKVWPQFTTSIQQPTFQPEGLTETKEPGTLSYRTATFTGFRELPLLKAFLILILWHPRFYIPWITALHEFNVYDLKNPPHWKEREQDLHRHDGYLYIFGKLLIGLCCALFVDFTRNRKKWELQYYIYVALLVLFALSPVAGGFVEWLLRDGISDGQLYKDWWFTSIVLIRWSMSMAFIMFPIQFACIYAQHYRMSRNAHYIWSSIFVFVELLIGYIAHLVIPPPQEPCPTRDWSQIVVWVVLFVCLATAWIMTVITIFAVPTLKNAMLKFCKKTKTQEPELNPDPFVDPPFKLILKKLLLFSMIALPIICSNFSFSIMEKSFPEDWNVHDPTSALGIFLLYKIIGVILMASSMFVIRKTWKRRKQSSLLEAEMLYLGMPHCWFALALVILVGRFVTLSSLNEGDVIFGPIPDDDKTVLVFVNNMFRNRTICLTSKYFPSTRIRSNQSVSIVLGDIGNRTEFFVNMEVDPRSEPVVKTFFPVEDIKKGEWKIYSIVLLGANVTQLPMLEYYKFLYSQSLYDVGNPGPRVGPPQLLILEYNHNHPLEYYYYEMNHSDFGTPFRVDSKNSVKNMTPGFNAMWKILWEVPATGRWTVRKWNVMFDKSQAGRIFRDNCTQCDTVGTFDVVNNSLYLLTDYFYEEKKAFLHEDLRWFEEELPPGVYRPPRYPMAPLTYQVHKLGEVAGPDSDCLPSREELQKDWAIKHSMAFAGMAAGGMYLGFIHLSWIDPPYPKFRVSSLALCSLLIGTASKMAEDGEFELGVILSSVLLVVQVFMTGLHFAGAYFMWFRYAEVFNFRTRPD